MAWVSPLLATTWVLPRFVAAGTCMTSLGTFLALVADATDSYCTSSFRPPLLGFQFSPSPWGTGVQHDRWPVQGSAGQRGLMTSGYGDAGAISHLQSGAGLWAPQLRLAWHGWWLHRLPTKVGHDSTVVFWHRGTMTISACPHASGPTPAKQTHFGHVISPWPFHGDYPPPWFYSGISSGRVGLLIQMPQPLSFSVSHAWIRTRGRNGWGHWFRSPCFWISRS